HRAATAVDDALATDLDHVSIRQDRERWRLSSRPQQLVVGERASDQALAQLAEQPCVSAAFGVWEVIGSCHVGSSRRLGTLNCPVAIDNSEPANVARQPTSEGIGPPRREVRRTHGTAGLLGAAERLCAASARSRAPCTA